jgi:release factor glutamine methyltransferase
MNRTEDVEAWTIGRVVRWAGDDFRRRGFESPRLDAELLLAHALGIDRVRLIIDAQRELAPHELARYRELIVRRRAHEPVAYILGEREFYGLRFRVDARVLVPRPDSEALVDVALERTQRWSLYGRALDLCTGSGCVAIAFAKRRPAWRVTGLDLSSEAVSLARYNAFAAGAVWGVAFAAGDLFEPLAENAGFEVVTANPPYIPSGEIRSLAADIRDFEPRFALDGGTDGLDVTRRIVRDAPARLVPGGILAVEVHHDQAERVTELFLRAGFASIERRRDYAGHERVVSGVRRDGD